MLIADLEKRCSELQVASTLQERRAFLFQLPLMVILVLLIAVCSINTIASSFRSGSRTTRYMLIAPGSPVSWPVFFGALVAFHAIGTICLFPKRKSLLLKTELSVASSSLATARTWLAGSAQPTGVVPDYVVALAEARARATGARNEQNLRRGLNIILLISTALLAAVSPIVQIVPYSDPAFLAVVCLWFGFGFVSIAFETTRKGKRLKALDRRLHDLEEHPEAATPFTA